MSGPDVDLNTVQLEGHYKLHVERTYIGSHDLMRPDGSHGATEVEIDGIYSRMIYNPRKRKKEKCLIASFKDKPKDFIINPTNQASIVVLAKTELVQSWVGVKLRLVVKKVKAEGGAMVDGLRIEAPQGKK